MKALGTRGSGAEPVQHRRTASRRTRRTTSTWPTAATAAIQVFDTDLNPVKIIANVGAPWSVCTRRPAPTQYLFSGDGNGKIYKLDLNGKLLGWAQTSQGHGQTGCLIHELHCESETVIYKGDCSTWTVEKITIAELERGSSSPSPRRREARSFLIRQRSFVCFVSSWCRCRQVPAPLRRAAASPHRKRRPQPRTPAAAAARLTG